MITGIQVSGLDVNDRNLLRLIARLHDLRPFWPIARTLWIKWEGQQFDSQGGFGGSPWQALSSDYAAFKTQVYPGKKILSADGDLRRKVTTPKSIVGPTMLVLVVDEYTHGKSKVPSRSGKRVSPSWFQEGTATMPARPLVFELPASAWEEFDLAIDRYAAEIVTSIFG